MPRLALTTAIVALSLFVGCSNHRSHRNATSPALDPAPPLTRSDRDVFVGMPVKPGEPGGSSGTNAGSVPGVGVGNGGEGGGGGGGGGGGSAVPEPGTMLLVGTGLAMAALSRRRR